MKISIKWVVWLIFLGIVAAGMLTLFVFGLPWIENTILYPERTKLIRYYACSLAICTKGCDGTDPDNIVDRICLENYTDTETCDVECKSICQNWGSPGPDTACGRNYPIELSLQGKGPLGGVIMKGVYRVWYKSLIQGCVFCSDAADIIDFMKYGRVAPCRPEGYKYIEVPQGLMNIIGFPLSITGSFAETSSAGRYPDFPEPDELLGSGCGTGLFGGIVDASRNDIGEGAILLDQGVAREAFGCFPQSPYDDIFASSLCNVGDTYYQCDFKGRLYLWGTKTTSGCADVTINSTPPEPGEFWVEVEPVSPPDRIVGKKVMVTLDEEAIYTVTIHNSLGTGADFTLEFGLADEISSYGPNPVCQFSSTSETVFSGETRIVELRCLASSDPSELSDDDREDLVSGEKWIDVMVSTPAYGSRNDQALLEVVDLRLDVWVSGNKPIETITKDIGVDAEYTVEIRNNFNTQEDFDLSYIPNDPSVTCDFDLNPLTVNPQTFDTTTMRCRSPNLGSYTIEVKASHADTDLEKYDDVYLTVSGCSGDLIMNGPYDVESGGDVDVYVTGFTGCQGRTIYLSVIDLDLVVDTCLVDVLGSGDECTFLTHVANTPGYYRMYVKMDMDPPIGTRINSTTLTISVDPPQAGGVYTYPWPNDLACDFSFGGDCSILTDGPDICDKCGNCVGELFGYYEGEWRFPFGVPVCGMNPPAYACTDYGDPQSNSDRRAYNASASNLCCVSGQDYYSPGPSDAPCLSPDDNTHHDKTDVFSYMGPDTYGDFGRVLNPRNILVMDERYAEFRPYALPGCVSDLDCDGFLRWGVRPDLLDGVAKCDVPPASGYCYLTDVPLNYYGIWLFFRISPDYRPVYGLQIRYKGCGGDGDWVGLNIFMHDSNGWFLAHQQGTSDDDSLTTFNVRPSEWAWNNVDAVMLAIDRFSQRQCIDIDYVGLLSPGNVPYCTYGTGDYNRVVDNGKKCYWDLDCPPAGSGWTTSKPVSSGVGPFAVGGGTCGCDNPGVTCGRGYCNFSYSSPSKELCYHNVACKNGGWSGDWKICGPSENCGSDGGTCAVSCQDLLNLITSIPGSTVCGEAAYDPVADVNKDGTINISDLSLVGMYYNNGDWCEARLGETTSPC